MMTAPPPETFTLRVETTEGPVEHVLDFSPFDPTYEQAEQFARIMDATPASDERREMYRAAAIAAFCRLDLPDDDWEVIGPVLIDAIDPTGSTEHIEVVGGDT